VTANLLTLNSSKTEFLLLGLPQQLAKINTSSLITTHSDRNLGFILDEHLTFSDQISALFKSCYYHIRELRCIRPCLDFKTASTIATSVVHFKLDYCNSLYYNLSQSQVKKIQNIQNSLARAVTTTPKSSRITPFLKSLHWLNISDRIKCKLLSLTCKFLTTHQPRYLHDLISVQPCHNTRSSSMVSLARPPTPPSLKITNLSFRYAAPCLWNVLPTAFREPRQTQSPSLSPITHGSSSSSSLTDVQVFVMIIMTAQRLAPFMTHPTVDTVT